MEIAVQILKHLPAGWPRIVALIGLGLLFFFPELRRLVSKRRHDKENVDRVKVLLELRKLELSVVGLQAQHPEAKNEHVDSEIARIFRELSVMEPEPVPKKKQPLPWIERLKFSLIGSFTLLVLGGVALWLSGRFAESGDTLKVILIELVLAVMCGFLASALPCRNRWECIFRGFLIPALLGALTVTAMGNN